MSSGVFRKTDDGKAEIAQRRAGLAPAARQLLILVNGSDSVNALMGKALQQLHQHFGPDTVLVARALLAARTPAAYQQALDGIESRLAIYMGRKPAARELAGLKWAP